MCCCSDLGQPLSAAAEAQACSGVLLRCIATEVGLSSARTTGGVLILGAISSGEQLLALPQAPKGYRAALNQLQPLAKEQHPSARQFSLLPATA
ncbi:hypothetical protein WJX72_004874 [[Myrmecia] bisecta]|uniref:Uncharacterized protein n=1 Tax=[Myrmecia] bisecta TaxID=41462 RepID=A0AAW1QF75_9CHLO